MTITISVALLILRLVLGLIMTIHGTQKLFGWFAGPGNYSLDALFRIALPEALLFGLLAIAALLIDLIGLFITRPTAVTPNPGSSHAS